jgi:hypothetical protein
MNNLFALTDKKEALTIISKELLGDNWKDAILIDQNGEMIQVFLEKEKAKQFNDIISFGGFNTQDEAYQLLHDCLILKLEEIVDWLVEGNNEPFKIFFTFEDTIGYAFDNNGNEVETNKIQLCLRKDRKNNTHFGMFVSHFHPIYEFIE